MNPLRRLTHSLSAPLLVLLLADGIVAYGALFAGAWIRFGLDLAAATQILGPLVPRAVTYAGCVVLGLTTMGLYRTRQRPTLMENIVRVLVGVGIGGFCHVLFFYLFPYYNTGRLTLAIAMVISFLGIALVRGLLLRFLDYNPLKWRVLLIGSGQVAAKVGLLRRRSDRRRFEVVGFVPGSDAEREFAVRNAMGPLLAPDFDFEQLPYDEVIVALDDRRGRFPTAQLLRHRSIGIPVRDIADFLEQETSKVDLDVLHPGWLIFATSGHSRWGFRIAKRLIDVGIGTVMLLLASPLLAMAAAAIRIEEGWSAPLFYRQRRVGRGGREFELLKFRSMHLDAEQGGPLWASRQGDARVTRAGAVMRRFRIDELPQLVNVIRGEMSIVGPRPERPEFVSMLNQNLPLYDYRHCMRPGLAGWAQLNFPYGASVEDANEKLKYDLFYIKNTGILFDLVILMQTLEVVIWGRGTSMAGPKAGAGDDGRPADSDRMDAAAGQGRGPAGRRQGDDGPAAERHAAQR
ncbi:MAG: TIGR03013 family XrtA/PEP-CTERM system glycosyltransferase [Gammaproteobacteria bacterium]